MTLIGLMASRGASFEMDLGLVGSSDWKGTAGGRGPIGWNWEKRLGLHGKGWGYRGGLRGSY